MGEYQKRLTEINDRILELYHLGSDTESIIASLSFKNGLEEMQERQRDISSLLLRHKAIMAEQEKEISMEMWRLAEEEETLKRIWICYRALDTLHFRIVRRLYVEKSLYAAVEKEFCMSHGKFEKERAAAIRRIMELYCSDMDNLQILKQNDVI